MFWKRRKQLPMPRPEIKKPEPREITDADMGMSERELNQYRQFAQTLDFQPSPVLRAEILLCLKNAKILIYNPQEVFAYLNLKPQRTVKVPGKFIPDDPPSQGPIYRQWVWRRLKRAALPEEFQFGRAPDQLYYQYFGRYRKDIGSYNMGIPLRVLQNASCLHNHRKDIDFFISDVCLGEERLPGDSHFIMAFNLEMGGIIFGSWEEGEQNILPETAEA